MYSYTAMNVVFMLVALVIIVRLKVVLNRRALLISAVLLLGSMLIFNTYLTALPIVRYNSERILAWRLGTIPLEDFAYLAVALVLAPSLYTYLTRPTNTDANK